MCPANCYSYANLVSLDTTMGARPVAEGNDPVKTDRHLLPRGRRADKAAPTSNINKYRTIRSRSSQETAPK